MLYNLTFFLYYDKKKIHEYCSACVPGFQPGRFAFRAWLLSCEGEQNCRMADFPLSQSETHSEGAQRMSFANESGNKYTELTVGLFFSFFLFLQ